MSWEVKRDGRGPVSVFGVDPTRHRIGATLVVVGFTVAISLMAMVARSPLSRATPVNAASAHSSAAALALVLAGAGTVGVTALAFLVAQASRSGREHDRELVVGQCRSYWLHNLVAAILALAFAGALIAAAVLGATSSPTAPQVVGGSSHGPGLPERRAGATSSFALPGWLPWTLLAIVVLAVVAGAIFIAMRSRRRPREESADRAVRRAAVEAAIDAIERRDDPRRAVIAAYTAMEQVLAAHGVARANTEAPREYLYRLLVTTSPAEREARTLTALFEEARYSTHRLPDQARDDALSALGKLREQL